MLQYAYPRQPDFSFRVYDGEARRRSDTAGQLRRLARLLDGCYQLPGGFRIGWDGILGFVPGLGDLATNLLSFYIVVQAALLGAPTSILLRMGINLLVDNALDAIPLLGNFLDFAWKANLKNVDLLDRYLANPGRAAARSRWAVAFTLGGLTLFALALTAAAIVASIAAFRWLVHAGGGW